MSFSELKHSNNEKFLDYQKLEKTYDLLTEQFGSIEPTTNVYYMTLLNMLRVENSDDFIEVGCGTCPVFPYLAQKRKPDSSYTAVDISENMLKIAVQRITEYSQNPFKQFNRTNAINALKTNTFKVEKNFPAEKIYVEQLNGENLISLKDEQFDTYLANCLLYLALDPDKMVKECYRVLEKGGCAGFSVWGKRENSSFPTIYQKVLRDNDLPSLDIDESFRFNDRDRLVDLFKKAGFTDIFAWYQSAPFYFTTKQGTTEAFNVLNPEMLQSIPRDKVEKVEKEYVSAIEEILFVDRKPLELEALMIIMRKL